MNILTQGKIRHRVWAITWLAILTLATSAFIDVAQLKTSVLEEKAHQTQLLVETAYGLLQHYEQLASAGVVSREKAQRDAAQAVRKLRYGSSDYFWINDRTHPFPRMLMHPTQPHLDGVTMDSPHLNTATHFRYGNASDFILTAGNENPFVLFNKIIDSAGHGFVRYEWSKGAAADQTAPKMSYVRLFEPWGWVIGTGVYIDDVDQLIHDQSQRLLLRTILASLVILGIASLIVRNVDNIETDLINQKIQMQALIDATTESVLLLDAKGEILAINHFGARRFQRPTDDVLGANFFDLLPEQLAKTRRAACDDVIRTGEPILTRDERRGIMFENNIYPVRNRDGSITSVAVYAKDITEQQRFASTEELFRHLDTIVLKWQMDSRSVAQIFCESLLPIFDLAAAWISKVEDSGNLSLYAMSEATTTPFLREEHLPKHWRCGSNIECKAECPHKWPMACQAVQSGQKQLTYLQGHEATPHLETARSIGIQASLAIPITLQNHRWGVLTVYAKDGEELKRAQRLLLNVTNRLAAVLESALQHERSTLLDAALSEIPSAIFVLNKEMNIVWSNAVFAELCQLPVTDCERLTQVLQTTPDDQRLALQNAVATSSVWRGQLLLTPSHGAPVACQLMLKPLHKQSDSDPHFVGVIETWLDQ